MRANSQSYIILNINLFCYLFDTNVRKVVLIIRLNIQRLYRHFSMQYGMLLFLSLPRYIIFFIAKYFSSLFSYCKYFRWYILCIYTFHFIYYFILQTNSYNLKFTWYPLANHSIAVSTSFYLLINPIAFIQLVTHMEGYFFFFKSKVQCSVKPTIRNVTRFYLFYNGIIKPW